MAPGPLVVTLPQQRGLSQGQVSFWGLQARLSGLLASSAHDSVVGSVRASPSGRCVGGGGQVFKAGTHGLLIESLCDSINCHLVETISAQSLTADSPSSGQAAFGAPWHRKDLGGQDRACASVVPRGAGFRDPSGDRARSQQDTRAATLPRP